MCQTAAAWRRDFSSPEIMMRAINLFFLLFFICTAVYSSESIYGSAFDYKKAKPANIYFSGKTQAEIKIYCEKVASATIDLSVCAQFGFEGVAQELNRKFREIEKEIAIGDKDRRANGEPEATPYLKKAQANWKRYRDDQCYARTYEVGQASLRFVEFWDCMARVTRNRLNELTTANED